MPPTPSKEDRPRLTRWWQWQPEKSGTCANSRTSTAKSPQKAGGSRRPSWQRQRQPPISQWRPWGKTRPRRDVDAAQLLFLRRDAAEERGRRGQLLDSCSFIDLLSFCLALGILFWPLCMGRRLLHGRKEGQHSMFGDLVCVQRRPLCPRSATIRIHGATFIGPLMNRMLGKTLP